MVLPRIYSSLTGNPAHRPRLKHLASLPADLFAHISGRSPLENPFAHTQGPKPPAPPTKHLPKHRSRNLLGHPSKLKPPLGYQRILTSKPPWNRKKMETDSNVGTSQKAQRSAKSQDDSNANSRRKRERTRPGAPDAHVKPERTIQSPSEDIETYLQGRRDAAVAGTSATSTTPHWKRKRRVETAPHVDRPRPGTDAVADGDPPTRTAEIGKGKGKLSEKRQGKRPVRVEAAARTNVEGNGDRATGGAINMDVVDADAYREHDRQVKPSRSPVRGSGRDGSWSGADTGAGPSRASGSTAPAEGVSTQLRPSSHLSANPDSASELDSSHHIGPSSRHSPEPSSSSGMHPGPRSHQPVRPHWTHWRAQSQLRADAHPFIPQRDSASAFTSAVWTGRTSESGRGRGLVGNRGLLPRSSSHDAGLGRAITGRRGGAVQVQGVGQVVHPFGGRIRIQDETSYASRQVLQMREDVRWRVQNAVRCAFGDQYCVEFFGSTRYGVSFSDSDLDMVIIDPTYPQGYTKTDIPDPIYKSKKLANCIRKAGFKAVETRPRSTVPIVKFQDPITSLECDLNVNSTLGVINSDMIKTYISLYPPLKALIFEIKEWGKPLGLNSPTGTREVPVSWSSYSLTGMAVAWCMNQGLLPNLQAGLPPMDTSSPSGSRSSSRSSRRNSQATTDVLTSDSGIGAEPELHLHLTDPGLLAVSPAVGSSLADEPTPTSGTTVRGGDQLVWTLKPHRGWDARYWPADAESVQAEMRAIEGVRGPERSVKELFAGWLDFWAKFDFERQAVCIRMPGGIVDRESPEVWDATHREKLPLAPICVVDPFIRSKNCTVSIAPKTLDKFKEECTKEAKVQAARVTVEAVYASMPGRHGSGIGWQRRRARFNV